MMYWGVTICNCCRLRIRTEQCQPGKCYKADSSECDSHELAIGVGASGGAGLAGHHCGGGVVVRWRLEKRYSSADSILCLLISLTIAT